MKRLIVRLGDRSAGGNPNKIAKKGELHFTALSRSARCRRPPRGRRSVNYKGKRRPARARSVKRPNSIWKLLSVATLVLRWAESLFTCSFRFEYSLVQLNGRKFGAETRVTSGSARWQFINYLRRSGRAGRAAGAGRLVGGRVRLLGGFHTYLYTLEYEPVHRSFSRRGWSYFSGIIKRYDDNDDDDDDDDDDDCNGNDNDDKPKISFSNVDSKESKPPRSERERSIPEGKWREGRKLTWQMGFAAGGSPARAHPFRSTDREDSAILRSVSSSPLPNSLGDFSISPWVHHRLTVTK
ncbi:hypothetical protein EVAR_32020_1 [Eumeta japonica]|uniref:Uncharacterized protein n=1 Tax=Eumeta variegata TaxID=151549 RepID=A0A4C1YL94_EUMVA|nr:hypothetical protein EVAR_32020_1 [Eumeta japonica]